MKSSILNLRFFHNFMSTNVLELTYISNYWIAGLKIYEK
jgi:hypothetical protein